MKNKITIYKLYHWDHTSYDASYRIIDGYQFIVDKSGYCDLWQLSDFRCDYKQSELLQKYFEEENFVDLDKLLKEDFGIRLPEIDEIDWLELLVRN